MVNIFKVKRIISYLFPPIFSVASFIIFIYMGSSFWVSLLSSVGIGIAFGLVGYKITAHPFVKALEGSGILILNFDSTGVIRTYIAKVSPPKLIIPKKGEALEDIWDRDVLTYLETPKQIQATVEDNKIVIDKSTMQKAGFALDVGLPVLLYNENLKTFITKDFLMGKEEKFLKHIAL